MINLLVTTSIIMNVPGTRYQLEKVKLSKSIPVDDRVVALPGYINGDTFMSKVCPELSKKCFCGKIDYMLDGNVYVTEFGSLSIDFVPILADAFRKEKWTVVTTVSMEQKLTYKPTKEEWKNWRHEFVSYRNSPDTFEIYANLDKTSGRVFDYLLILRNANGVETFDSDNDLVASFILDLVTKGILKV